jgi:sec-independent protein translocase protein TatA
VRATPVSEDNIMPNIGFSELIVILLILVLVFGASRLPALGEGVGRAIRSFKRGIAQDENIEVGPVDENVKAPAKVASVTDSKRVGAGSSAQVITDAEIIEEKKS